MEKLMKLVALPDIHLATKPDANGEAWVPDVSDALWTALSFCKYFKPDVIIILGDFMDFDLLGRKEPNNRLDREGRRLIHDFELANKILDFLDKLNPLQKIFMMGNHDMWLHHYIAENPILQGTVGITDGLDLRRRNWVVVEEGAVFQFGNATFTHGWYTNQYHAAKTVREAGTNVFYGHAHTIQAFSKPNICGKPIIAQCMGCLCDLNPEYWRNKPSWAVNGFGVFYFRESGDFTFYNPVIINGEMIWNGRVFSGSPNLVLGERS